MAWAPGLLGPYVAVALIGPRLPDRDLQLILAALGQPVLVLGGLALVLASLPLVGRFNIPSEPDLEDSGGAA